MTVICHNLVDGRPAFESARQQPTATGSQRRPLASVHRHCLDHPTSSFDTLLSLECCNAIGVSVISTYPVYRRRGEVLNAALVLDR